MNGPKDAPGIVGFPSVESDGSENGPESGADDGGGRGIGVPRDSDRIVEPELGPVSGARALHPG